MTNMKCLDEKINKIFRIVLRRNFFHIILFMIIITKSTGAENKALDSTANRSEQRAQMPRAR